MGFSFKNVAKSVKNTVTDKFAIAGSVIGGVAMGPLGVAGGAILGKKFGEKTAAGTAPELVGGQLRTGEDIEKLNKQLEAERGRLRGLETQARGRLSETTGEVGSAIDKRLESLLEESGFQAGEARKVVGAQFAARGLGRSTFATEQIGEVGQSLLQQQAGLRQEASQQKGAVEQRARAVAQSISDQRVDISNRLRDLERQGLQSVQFESEIQDIRLEFDRFLADLQVDEMQQVSLMNTISGVAGLGGFAAGSALTSSGEEG